MKNMKKFTGDVFKAVASTGVTPVGWRHVARKGRNLVARTQIAEAVDAVSCTTAGGVRVGQFLDYTEDIFVYEITPEGVVTFVGREPSGAD